MIPQKEILNANMNGTMCANAGTLSTYGKKPEKPDPAGSLAMTGLMLR